MKTIQELRAGNIIKIGKDLHMILKATYNKSGRNEAVVKTKLKNLTTGATSETVYRASDKVDDIRLDKRPMQYIFSSGDVYTFMDQESYEQIEISKDDLGDNLNYLKENMELDALLYEGKAISIELPTSVEMEITYTENAVRGDTTGKVLKTAKVESGFEVQVPLFCDIGDKIRIDTRTGEYLERVK